MTPAPYTEDDLVQRTTADYLEDRLGWESVNGLSETFGPDGTLGRTNDREVVLVRRLRAALETLNPGLPAGAYDGAIRMIVDTDAAQSTLQTNREKYHLLRNGVKVTYPGPRGSMETRTLRVFDFGDPENNHFLAVRELWIRGPLYRRRADVVGFVNGVPLLFMELKNVQHDIRRAWDGNLSDYRDAIPHVFHHNAFVVLGNGVDARIGAWSAPFAFFREWKRLDEDDPGVVDMETLLKGVCAKENFLDLFENFILFDDSGERPIKIVAQNQQYLGVNRAVRAVEERDGRGGRLGVYWHTQGAGKSYSMVFFSRKVHRRLGANFTFLVLCDRNDLDDQIYRTYAGCGVVGEHDDVRADSGRRLKALLGEHNKRYVFSLIQKFNEEVPPGAPYSDRDDIIVVVDEAHRTQYGRLALNQRTALPNAVYIAFTGTPLMKDDEITRQVFGDYVSRYGFQRAVEDGATVPLYYDARGDRLGLSADDLDERIAEKLEEFETEDIDVEQRLDRELKREYHLITAPERLDAVARDFVDHCTTRWESGKAMFVAIDKITAVKMHGLIGTHWQDRIAALEDELAGAPDAEAQSVLKRQLVWMQETEVAVVVSEEQGEVAKFRKWNLDITPHRRRIKEGFEAGGERIDVESAFRKDGHPFRVAIVCAMWLTGFDVKSLSTLYLDKPLKAHTLMQAIARANRVHESKNNGLVVDYCGILKNLRKALATFAGHTGGDGGGAADPPARPQEALLRELADAIGEVREFLAAQGFRLADIIEKTGFEKNAAIVAAKEAVNENDETRKRFELMARAVFRKFRACLTVDGVHAHRPAQAALDIVYKRLQEDRDRADISEIMQALHEVVGAGIAAAGAGARDRPLYDISAIDFERLRQEFPNAAQKNTHVQNLKAVIEKRLAVLLAQNPMRTNFQEQYEELVAEYNREKDRATIERTFEELLRFVDELDDEAQRAVREGLDEPTLALFDLLKKDELSRADIERIKHVAKELHAKLDAEFARLREWRAKEATRDGVKQMIHDHLYSDETGLPESVYSAADVEAKSAVVFAHCMNRPPEAPWTAV